MNFIGNGEYFFQFMDILILIGASSGCIDKNPATVAMLLNGGFKFLTARRYFQWYTHDPGIRLQLRHSGYSEGIQCNE